MHQPNPIVWQSPPLALMETPTLMETLSHYNIHAYTPHQCFYLSPFDINEKGYLPLGLLLLTGLSLGLLPLSICLWYFFYVYKPMITLSPFIWIISPPWQRISLWSHIVHSSLVTIAPLRNMLLCFLSKNLHLHLINISPFLINGKGIFPSGVAPPNKTLPEIDLPT